MTRRYIFVCTDEDNMGWRYYYIRDDSTVRRICFTRKGPIRICQTIPRYQAAREMYMLSRMTQNYGKETYDAA